MMQNGQPLLSCEQHNGCTAASEQHDHCAMRHACLFPEGGARLAGRLMSHGMAPILHAAWEDIKVQMLHARDHHEV